MSHPIRAKHILERLQGGGEASIAPLAVELGVSEMTVRRDLDALAAAGRVIRTHGGATLPTHVAFEFSFMRRRGEQPQGKEAIGAAAAERVPDGASVLLDSGTTTLAVARALRARKRLRVITTSLPIAAELQVAEDFDIVLLGGSLRRESPDLIGPLTEANLEGLRADLAFIGADAVDARGGVYNASMAVAGLLDRMARSAREVYIVADHTKLDRTALARFGRLTAWAGLVTDAAPSSAAVRQLKRAGVRVHCAR